MCGIAGYLNLNGRSYDPAGSNYLPAMMKSITHRGPDENGSIIVGPAALSMTRLAIIDLKTGQQPIFNEDESICIVFNGEIYNFEELRDRLLANGHQFRTGSDTEVIVHLYEELGVDCLKHLEGMFAFALWDSNKKRLFLARDRMGEKPLHWSIFDGQFIFASEIKSILEHPAASKSLNAEALRQYLALESVPAPNTLFRDIYKLLPAHYMVIEQGKVNIASYWTPSMEVSDMGEAEAKEKLLALLDESIRLRLISDVPLGVFLSGGIDSSTIAALAAKHTSGRLKTFSIGFSDSSFDESNHARTVADHLGTSHQVMEFQPDLAFATMQELWQVLDEPIADASIVPTFLLAKMTKESVTVALSGEGGDELLGGYPTYQAHRLAGIWNKIPQILRGGILEPLINSLPVSHKNLSFDYKLKRFIASSKHEPLARQLRWMGGLPMDTHQSLLRPSLFEDAGSMSDELDLISHLDLDLLYRRLKKEDVVDQIMRLDQMTYLADDLLVKSDRATMAASLEARL
ncbi:MAG: asparagine synthase (glutamine-hydrolyzing), partial [Candidatus Obscuribacterales bacterium]|nr:asparagine synthase (glutamine-hydrolyzing) [Candidatus Obscuribacterales bacterium]